MSSWSGDGSNSGSNVDTDAGAAGTSTGSFSLSTGGLVAIIVVVAFVVIAAGAVSVLWYLAKRRQWDVRASIRRASRRLTGRGPGPGYVKQESSTRADRKSKRVGFQMETMPAAATSSKSQARSKVVEVRDLERGLAPKRAPVPAPAPPQSKKTGMSWVDRFHVATNDGS